jgi:Uncharacterized alpha/beta hydrolase domain (DUF2235)
MSNHMQESTAISFTDTVVDYHDGHERPHMSPTISGNSAPSPVSPTGTCVNSDGDFKQHKSVSTESVVPGADGEPAIPPRSDPAFKCRTLVVCFDGTGDQFDDDNSNVVNFVSLLKKDVPAQQMVYYQVASDRDYNSMTSGPDIAFAVL